MIAPEDKFAEDEKRVFQGFFLKIVETFSEYEKKIYFTLGFSLLLLVALAAMDLINIKKIFAFMLFVIIGGAFKYIISKYNLGVEFTPIVFFSVVIGKYFGLFWVIVYIIAADIMVEFITKTGPTGGSVPYWIWMFLIAIMGKPFNLLGFGMFFIPIIYFFGSIAIDQFLKGGTNIWRFSSTVANLTINLYFFIKLSEFFIGMVS
jgi:hypothetical protein